jgi:hypothetical protein
MQIEFFLLSLSSETLASIVNRIGLPAVIQYSCEVLTQKITQAVHPLRGYTLFSFVRSGK